MRAIDILLRMRRRAAETPALLAAMLASAFPLGTEPGGVYRYSDFSTLFQDMGGTPVTAVEQSVAMALDIRGGLALGAEQAPSTDFSSGWSVSAGVAVAPGSCTFTAAADDNAAYFARTGVIGKVYRIVYTIQSISGGGIEAYDGAASFAVGPTRTAPGTYSETIGTPEAGAGNFALRAVGTTTAVISSFSIKEILGNHQVQPTSTARRKIRQDGAGKYYLQGDATDDWAYTQPIDFSASDKLTFSLGMHLQTTTTQVVTELSVASDTQAGSYGLLTVGNIDYIALRGSAQTDFNNTPTILVPVVQTFQFDIAGAARADEFTIRRNGVAQTWTGGGIGPNAGTGNFGNHRLHFACRNGVLYFSNVREYAHVVHGGATSAGQRAAIEAWVASETGVTL